MKKIIFLLFLFLIALACFLIYNITEKEKMYCLVIGDSLADNPYLKNSSNFTEYNNYYVNETYRLIDLINIIKYNEEQEINDKNISIHQLLKKADIVVISIGMNNLYFDINNDAKHVYTTINSMVNEMEELLGEIDKYYHKKTFLIGYYNITNSKDDLFSYLNYKMKRVAAKKNIEYIELNHIINYHDLQKKDYFVLNNNGYQKINKIILEKLKNN